MAVYRNKLQSPVNRGELMAILIAAPMEQSVICAQVEDVKQCKC